MRQLDPISNLYTFRVLKNLQVRFPPVDPQHFCLKAVFADAYVCDFVFHNVTRR